MAILADIITELVSATATAVGKDQTIARQLRKLLLTTAQVRSTLDLITVLPATLNRLAAAVSDVVDAILPDIIQDNSEHLSKVRRFFCEPQETYTLQELATLWQITLANVRDVFEHQLHKWAETHPDDPDALQIKWADAARMSVSFPFLSPSDVEVALGEDFSHARSDRWRTVPVLIRLPQFMADAIVENSRLVNRRSFAFRTEYFFMQLYQQSHEDGTV